ncbi:hypothetical protein H7I77_05235 [Mycolicibacterium novocastrense]|uniref:Choice-of-anchor G family protein n=1 Tax=Mycolicibacterium novocastrense TaxID=59813 RepID=A0AAW5SGY1_MYCNV|nr:hypothetical protein [Mycolicibacterium novocastrense]MCV7022756.1 hypothetical protein [Mycolicibacterium novocastrense]GAT10329.1 uncharacterized protein RMCN_3462 [Mycolicibacterium novocastrense]
MYAAASRRSPLPALALTTAAALTLTPLVLPQPAAPLHLSLPQVSAPRLELTAAINPADVTALINNLNAALESASTTVTGLVGTPGQTLANALASAATLNDSLWDGLIDATDNRTLAAILTTLKDTAGNGLSRLSNSVDAANGTIVLTTGQLADLLTSTLTGSLGTALHAVATVINNPLALPSYTGLINTPLDIAGLLVTGGIGAVNNLGANVLTVTNTVVTGVTAQVDNALDTFNGLLSAGKTLTGIGLINGLLTAVQGIVSAPVTAAVAGVNGASTTITNAAATTLDKIADGASDAIATWIGDGTRSGAIQEVINTIGSAPLSPASYTHAVSVLVGAGITTVTKVAHTAGSLASVPFTAAADITTAAADVITALTSGLATAASGIMQAAGLPSLVYGLPHAMAATVNGLVNAAAFTTATGLRTIAAALDFGSAITGNLTSAAAPTSRAVTLTLATDTTTATDDAEPTPGDSAAAEPATHSTDAPAASTEPATDAVAVTEPAAETPPAAAEPDAETPAAAEPDATTDIDAETPVAETEEPTTAPTTDTTTTPAAGSETAETEPAAEAKPAAKDDAATANSDKPATAAPKKKPRGTDRATDTDDDASESTSAAGRATPDRDTTSATGSNSTRTPKHASETSPRHAAASTDAPKHAAAA